MLRNVCQLIVEMAVVGLGRTTWIKMSYGRTGCMKEGGAASVYCLGSEAMHVLRSGVSSFVSGRKLDLIPTYCLMPTQRSKTRGGPKL